MLKRNLLAAFALMGILLIGYRLLDSASSSSSVDDLSDDNAAPFPQAFYSDVEMVQYNRDGRPQQLFLADKLQSFQVHPQRRSADDYALIEAPRFTFFQPNREPWQLRAEHGRASQSLNIVQLSDAVHAHRTTGDGHFTEIETELLTVNMETGFGHTDKPVMIRHPQIIHTGVGMEIEFNREIFTLLSKVRSRYEPEP